MKYILLITVPDDAEADLEMSDRHMAFAQSVGQSGKLVDGAQLAAADTATTIRRRGDESIVTDGPHAETKEHLGGYYIVDCPDLDDAIAVARGVPLNDGGAVEIRPIVEA